MIDQNCDQHRGFRPNRPYGAQAFHEALLTAGFASITTQARFHTVCMICATFAALLGGAMLLSRVAHGTWSAVALACALLLLNRTLLAGFINYLSGVGVSLMGAAAWIALRERAPVIRLAAFAVIATAACAVHLFAGGVLGVIVVGIELAVLAEGRAGLRRCLIDLAVPAAAFLL